ncbi:uncharacterized protein LOC125225977 [Leguminivora glycinivorella]|uniref:uncharacterized protein LOC125225977 n=1 Tax=Leguminivora glycinivorella TaxID=1035111 RepID=UPI00200FD6D6|nr:uncharacterized protein LOC125225977 [Leguminivora glycinivorella]
MAVHKTARVRVVALRRMFIRRWDLIKKSTIRRTRNASVTPKESETSCFEPILVEAGTEMKNRTAVSTLTSNLNTNRHNTLKGTSAATSTVRWKTYASANTSAIGDMKQMVPDIMTTNHQTNTNHTVKTPFSGEGQGTLNGRLKRDCTVMNETSPPGDAPFQPYPLSQGVQPKKVNLDLPPSCPSKWADIVVNKIMRHISTNCEKKQITESRGTSTDECSLYQLSPCHRVCKTASEGSNQSPKECMIDEDAGSEKIQKTIENSENSHPISHDGKNNVLVGISTLEQGTGKPHLG